MKTCAPALSLISNREFLIPKQTTPTERNAAKWLKNSITSVKCLPWASSPKMHAWLIRAERFGKPTEAFQQEVVNTPSIADDEVLVYVMAAGINYNNVWAGLGIPVNVIGARNKAGELKISISAAATPPVSCTKLAKMSPTSKSVMKSSCIAGSGTVIAPGQGRRRSHVFAEFPHLGL